MKNILLTLILCAAPTWAAVPYWQPPAASTITATGTGYLSGTLNIYPSTTTAAASPTITLAGATGGIKASSITISNDAYFTGVASTVTVSGWIDIGWEEIKGNSAGWSQDTYCSSGKKPLGGGCKCTNEEVRSCIFYTDTGLADGNWYLQATCNASATHAYAYIICARVK